MKIRRLYIGDFGILRNQTLDHLGQGLVVIGGANRAGKTSFMQVLRHLGYGFPRGGNLPPATHAYHVEATIGLENDLWDLRIEGYGNPRVSGAGGRSIPASTLFGELDMFTYHQLFTISLDELRLLPEGVEKSEGKRLQSVLLGAGLADIARIPGVVRELDRHAYGIGASKGSPSVAKFKPYYEIIREHAKERDDALHHLDEYQAHLQDLANINNELTELEEQLASYKDELIRLEMLLHNHADYYRWVELGDVLADPTAVALLRDYPDGLLGHVASLQEKHALAVDEYNNRSLDLERDMPDLNLADMTLATWQERLLAHSQEIDFAEKSLSGVEARISAAERKALEQQAEHREIQYGMDGINRGWRGDLDIIEDIVHQVDKAELTKAIKEHGLITRAQRISLKIGQLTAPDIAKQLRNYWAFAIATMVLGVFVGLASPIFGASVVVLGAVGFGIYLVSKSISSRADEPMRRDLSSELLDIGSELGLVLDDKDIDQNMALLQRSMEDIVKQLDTYRVLLGLGEAAEFDSYLARLDDITGLYERIRRLRQAEDSLQDELDNIQSSLTRMWDLATRLGYHLPPPQPTTTYFHQLALLTQQMSTSLKRAEAMDVAGRELANLEKQVRLLAKGTYGLGQATLTAEDAFDVGKWLEDAIRAGKQHAEYKALAKEKETLKQRMLHSLGRREIAALEAFIDEAAASGEPWVDALTRSQRDVELLTVLYDEHLSKGDLEAALTKTEGIMHELTREIAELAAYRDDLSRKLADLDTDQTLSKAQRRIDEARRALEPLAMEYSVYRVAALMLETLQREFIKEVEDELLAKASNIFREMTGGDYKEIAPLEEITEVGFQVARTDGDAMLPDALSRATTEQLFLAVRLGRIQDIKPPLPMILDDCLVNFDTRHAYQAMQTIAALADRHQIFVLTCHPELVEMIHDVGREDTQYWQLDGGVFARSDAQDLVRHLGKA